MNHLSKATISLNLTALALVLALWGWGDSFRAFGSGLALFGVNLLLIYYVGARLFASTVTPADGAPPKVSPLFLPALFIKVMLLGGGAYLALVKFGLEVSFFIGGLVAGLVFFALPSIVLRRHFLLSTPAKVS